MAVYGYFPIPSKGPKNRTPNPAVAGFLGDPWGRGSPLNSTPLKGR